MTRKTKYTYTVKRNEHVRFRISPRNGASATVTAAQNGKTIPNTGTATTPVFEVVVDEVVGNKHFVKIEYSFFDAAPKDAEFQTSVRSNKGDSFDDIPAIKKKNTARERNFALEVVP